MAIAPLPVGRTPRFITSGRGIRRQDDTSRRLRYQPQLLFRRRRHPLDVEIALRVPRRRIVQELTQALTAALPTGRRRQRAQLVSVPYPPLALVRVPLLLDVQQVSRRLPGRGLLREIVTHGAGGLRVGVLDYLGPLQRPRDVPEVQVQLRPGGSAGGGGGGGVAGVVVVREG